MQNLINGTAPTINIDEIISNSVNNTQAKTAQGNDFTNILNNLGKDSQNNKTTNSRNDFNRRDVKPNDKNTKNVADTSQKKVKDQNVAKNDKTKNDNVTKNDKKCSQQDKIASDKTNTTKIDTQKTDTAQKDNVSTFETQTITDEINSAKPVETVQTVDTDAAIQDALNRLNETIENTLDGQLNIEDVNALKAALEEIQAKIDNNELVVSEDTQKMITSALDKLTSQDPKALEVKVLEQDLKQLSKDIRANAFKTQSQVKLEDVQNDPNKALEINIDNTKQTQNTDTKTTTTEKTEQKTKTTEATVAVSQKVTENTVTQKNENKAQEIFEQDMLDEMQVKIENVSTSNQSSNSNNQNFGTNAQDEIIKLSIQNADSNTTPATFVFDNKANAVQGANFKNIQVETAAKELNTNDVLNQIGSKFEQLKDGSQTKITMTLRPQDLGRVTIELSQNANGVSTNIIAQNSQVKELLDKNIDILKQQLAQQGVNVNNVQVKTVEQNAQTNLNNNFSNRENSQEQNQGQNFGSGHKQGQSQNDSQNKGFSFSNSNIIDNADFENGSSQTTQINTAGGKINYNL